MTKIVFEGHNEHLTPKVIAMINKLKKYQLVEMKLEPIRLELHCKKVGDNKNILKSCWTKNDNKENRNYLWTELNRVLKIAKPIKAK